MKAKEGICFARRARRRHRAASLSGILLALVLFAAPSGSYTAYAAQSVPLEAAELVPIGRTAGIKIYADGVIVTDLSEIDSPAGKQCPARDAGLQPGDVITHCGGRSVRTADELTAALTVALATAPAEANGVVELTVRRGEQTIVCRLTPLRDADGTGRIGALVRDSMAGIGTITFYDPQSGVFGALGHGICESETGMLMPIGSGCLIAATVTDVHRGEHGKPGELVGSFDLAGNAGSLTDNLDTGLFGTIECDELYPELMTAEAIPVAAADEIRAGKAEILANVAGNAVERYEIEIVRVETDRSTKNLYLRVTDPDLIAQTGGIVQGMSGSPIIQNGKLVGAVTHVLVNDPEYGYGITIENMLAAAE